MRVIVVRPPVVVFSTNIVNNVVQWAEKKACVAPCAPATYIPRSYCTDNVQLHQHSEYRAEALNGQE